MADPSSSSPWVVGRYAVYGEIASGGMAAVHLGRLLGPVGFSRTVAIKRLHPYLASDPAFVTMFLDEARVAARIRHPNVVPTFDVLTTKGQILLVMDYVQGQSLARLNVMARERGERVPAPTACSILVDTLHGLHAAHEATNERGEPLAIVHRDVSPQNILVGVDGVARVLDFGVAKAVGRLQTTREGKLKGKIGYMPPEQARSMPVSRLADIYAASIVLWETLVGARLFEADSEATVLENVLFGEIDPPSMRVPELPAAIDDIVMKGLSRDPSRRFATAREMAREIERRLPVASASDVGEWVEHLAGNVLAERARRVKEIESGSDSIPHAGELDSDVIGTAPSSSALGPPRFEEVTTTTTTTEDLADEDAPTVVESSPASEPLLIGAPSQTSVSTDSDPPGPALTDASLSRVEGVPTSVPAQRQPWGLIVAAVSGVALVGFIVVHYGGMPPSRTAATGVPAAAPETASVPVGAAGEPDASSAAPPVSSAIDVGGARASAVSAPSAVAPTQPHRASSGPARPPHYKPPDVVHTVGKSTCDPPYVIEPDGTKHYKLDCL